MLAVSHQGHPEQAHHHRQQAYRALEERAAHIPQAQARDRFGQATRQRRQLQQQPYDIAPEAIWPE